MIEIKVVSLLEANIHGTGKKEEKPAYEGSEKIILRRLYAESSLEWP